MIARIGLSLALCATVVGCKRDAARLPGNAGDAPPADLLAPAGATARPVVVRDGVAYLWLHMIAPYGDPPEWQPEAPACTEGSEACWRSMPAPAERIAGFGAMPPTLTLITADGPCQAKVEPVVIYNSSGCEPSMTYGAPVTGCGVDVAPVGFVGGAPSPDLRWLPAPVVTTTPLGADARALADPLHRRLVSEWLSRGELGATRHETRTALVSVDAGAESLTSVVAGALAGASADQCEWEVMYSSAFGIRRGDQLRELTIADELGGTRSEWDGALAWRGRVVGVAAGQPRRIDVYAIDAAGAVSVVLDEQVWWDNEECTQGNWAGIEYPCGP